MTLTDADTNTLVGALEDVSRVYHSSSILRGKNLSYEKYWYPINSYASMDVNKLSRAHNHLKNAQRIATLGKLLPNDYAYLQRHYEQLRHKHEFLDKTNRHPERTYVHSKAFGEYMRDYAQFQHSLEQTGGMSSSIHRQIMGTIGRLHDPSKLLVSERDKLFYSLHDAKHHRDAALVTPFEFVKEYAQLWAYAYLEDTSSTFTIVELSQRKGISRYKIGKTSLEVEAL